MEFASVQEFPLDELAALEADGGGQSQGDGDVEAGFLGGGADDLDFDGIVSGICWHGGRYLIRLLPSSRL